MGPNQQTNQQPNKLTNNQTANQRTDYVAAYNQLANQQTNQLTQQQVQHPTPCLGWGGGGRGCTHSVHTYPRSFSPRQIQMATTLGAWLSPRDTEKQFVHTWGEERAEREIKRSWERRNERRTKKGSTPFVANMQHPEVPKFREKPMKK